MRLNSGVVRRCRHRLAGVRLIVSPAGTNMLEVAKCVGPRRESNAEVTRAALATPLVHVPGGERMAVRFSEVSGARSAAIVGATARPIKTPQKARR